LITTAVWPELNFFFGLDILRLLTEHGYPRCLCEQCQLFEYGGWNWC
jgi:hypothetical protein